MSAALNLKWMAGPVKNDGKRHKNGNGDNDGEDAPYGKPHSSDSEEYFLADDPITVVGHGWIPANLNNMPHL